MESNSPDIDFIELFLFLKKKIVSIVLFVVFSLILSSIFLLANKNKINIKYELNMIANSPSMIINCGDDFYCKANIIQSIINNKSKFITSNIDERGKKINLSWAGDDRYKPLVTAEVNGKHQLVNLTIKEEAVDPDDVDMLQDMVIAAVNEAMRAAESDAANNMSRLTGGLNLGGLF